MGILYNLFQTLFGTYEPVKTWVYYPDINGDYQQYEVIADGIASWDITYILSVLFIMLVTYVIYRTIAYSITRFIYNSTKRMF